MSNYIHADLHCHAGENEKMSVQYSTDIMDPDFERLADLMFFIILTYRQVSNLKTHPSIGALGNQLTELGLWNAAFFETPGGTALMEFKEESSRKFQCHLTLHNEEMSRITFDLKTPGFGFFSKDLNLFAAISPFVVAEFFIKKWGSEKFTEDLATAAFMCGSMTVAGAVGSTNQNSLAIKLIQKIKEEM